MRLSPPESGAARSIYLGAMRWTRQRLDGTRLLSRWTDHAARHPRTTLSHIRTLLAVHNASDLVQLDLPWWTYEAIDIVDRHLSATPNARVFEFGSGASTIWLGRRAGSVHSVEHDKEWADQVENLAHSSGIERGRIELHLPHVPRTDNPRLASSSPRAVGLDFSAYVDVIRQVGGPFDLILVDGRVREACLSAALNHLSPTGLILFDDAHRPRYQAAIADAEASGWRVIRTRGSAPCEPFVRETVLLSAPLPRSE